MANKLNERKRFRELDDQGPCKELERDDCQSRDNCLVQPQQAHADVSDPRFGELCLEPKHKIFLSHSGVHKNFTEQLCKDLERVHYFPFFDKRPDSLPKGEKFPPLIFKAAQQCHVAILVLSEEFFTRSKWPMIELNEFVQAQASINSGLKFLPLFFGLTLMELKDAKRQERWLKVWQDWAHDDGRIDVEKWRQAVSQVLGPINGMEYDDGVGEVSYREEVVAAVCKMVRPDVKYDVSHVQSLARLCEPILQKLDEVELHSRYNVRIVGLFGMGGVGKTTISKALCNEKFTNFNGRVCHVELGGKNLMDLRRKVLQELTDANQEILTNDGDKLVGLLKTRMQQHKVFLCLDNVWEKQIEEAKMYLEVGYQHDSAVLVTSRSYDVIQCLKVNESCCLEMPGLEEEDATHLFLYHATPHENLNDNDWDIIKRCVKVCRSSKKSIRSLEYGSDMGQFLPLALKVWGLQLGHISDNPSRWESSLRNLRNHRFNHSKQQDHPLFSLLRQGYDALKTEDQYIFLDLALFGSCVSRRMVLKWFSVMYKKTRDAIDASLQALRKKALLEYSMTEGDLQFIIHDLYLEFAAEEAQAGAFHKRRILYILEESDVPRELMKRPSSGFWPCLERIGIYHGEMQSLKKASLHLCSNVEFLQLFCCHELAEVDVQGMDSLTFLGIDFCVNLGDKFEGVEKLKDLVWFQWQGIYQPAPFLKDLSSLTALQVLVLKGSHSVLRHPPNLSGCINLRELTLSGHGKLASFPDLSNLSRLETIDFSSCYKATEFPDLSNLCKLGKINFNYCPNATRMIGLSSLTNLKDLNTKYCRSVQELPGLGDLIALEILDVEGMDIFELDDLRKLGNLQVLCVKNCPKLTSMVGLEYLTSLRHLDASYCRNLKELNRVILCHSDVSILPSNFGRLARHCILEITGCVSLIESLVVYLMDEERQVREGAHGWISNGFSSSEQTTDNIWANIRKDVSSYMNQVFSDSQLSFEEKYLSSANTLGELEGGIEFVIRVLCEHSDIGVLSMVVAKYAATGDYWEKLTGISTIQPLCQGILHYLDDQVEALESPSKDNEIYGSSYWPLNRMHFILKHLINNRAMVVALGSDKICTLTQYCISCVEKEPITGYLGMPSSKGNWLKKFAIILERCKPADASQF